MAPAGLTPVARSTASALSTPDCPMTSADRAGGPFTASAEAGAASASRRSRQTSAVRISPSPTIPERNDGGVWLVDGNNVMGAKADGWWRDRPRAMQRLVDSLDT